MWGRKADLLETFLQIHQHFFEGMALCTKKRECLAAVKGTKINHTNMFGKLAKGDISVVD